MGSRRIVRIVGAKIVTGECVIGKVVKAGLIDARIITAVPNPETKNLNVVAVPMVPVFFTKADGKPDVPNKSIISLWEVPEKIKDYYLSTLEQPATGTLMTAEEMANTKEETNG